MPIYAFECTACGHTFDRLQKLSDADPTTCPACAAGGVRRQLTAPSFRLSGSGWYETDFKKDGRRNLAEGGDARSDAKPEPKPDAAAKPADTSAAAPAPKPAAAPTPPAPPKSGGTA
jgi:putative FmdB family regulatory protein